MPIQDMEPGTSPEAPGTFYFYKQGSAKTSGTYFDTEGDATFNGDVAVSGDMSVSGTIDGDIEGFINNPVQGFITLATDSATKNAAGTAINNAIAALPTQGGTILIPQGTWTIDTAVLVNKSGLIIRGVGNGVSLLRFDGSTITAAIKMADTTQRYAQFDNLRIESSASGQGTAIDASYFVNSVFSNLRIGSSGVNPNKGIVFNAVGSYYNIVKDSRISVSGAGSQCLVFDNVANSNVVQNCRLVGDNTNTVGVYVNAHAIELNRVDIETDFLIGIDVGASGHDCCVISPYIEAGETGVRLASTVESFTCVGGVIIDNAVANITDNGAKDPVFLNTRLQYEPYTSMTVRSSAFPRSYPVPSNTVQPQDHGLAAWTMDPTTASSSTTLTNGTQYFAAVYVRNPITITKLHFIVGTAAVTPTADQNWIGIYNSSGTKLAEADIDDLIITNGPQEATIASTALTPGVYWIGFLCNASTAVTITRAGGLSAAGNSINLTATGLRFFVNGTAKTALDASITPASNTSTGSVAYFAAIES